MFGETHLYTDCWLKKKSLTAHGGGVHKTPDRHVMRIKAC
jgi:hypothetical protein